MMPATQVKLLRVLQERTFRRLGGRQEQTVDVRVIAATNHDPAEAVRAGTLREDLFYRLNVFIVTLPPLRDRKDDLPLLVQSFIGEFNARNGKTVAATISRGHADAGGVPLAGERPRASERDRTGDDPGRGPVHRAAPPAGRPLASRRGRPSRPLALSPGTTVEEAERRLIEMTLEHTQDNKTRAAEVLGISLKTLHNKLNRLKLRK